MNGMTDSKPLVIAFDTTSAIAEAVKDRVLNDPRPEIHNAEKIVSVIVRMELQAKRDLSPEEIAKRKRFIEEVVVIPLKDDVEEEAIKIRQYTKLKLPDAIIAATAVKAGAVLLSYDGHFDNLDWPGLMVKKYL
jgi:predicted nucleic acid-binding protein